MYEQFIDKKFSPERLEAIEKINRILTEYQRAGMKVTLRQLHYQLVSRTVHIGAKLYENTQRQYKWLGELLNDARLAGLVDWQIIEDRGRSMTWYAHFNDAAECAEWAARIYREDLWENQDNRVIVMVEKQALEGVLEPLCVENDVRFCANKGYSSASAMYEAAKLVEEWMNDLKNVHVLYLGDHDPSGLDMTSDVRGRMSLLSHFEDCVETGHFDHSQFTVTRLALNWDQIEEYQPPVNPVKLTDSRCGKYIDAYGEECWELDALEPRMLRSLVESAIHALRDDDLWEEAIRKQDENESNLRAFAEEYRARNND